MLEPKYMKYKYPIICLAVVFLFGFTKTNSNEINLPKNNTIALPLFSGDYCTTRGDNKCFQNYVKKLAYTLPKRCDANLKGIINIQFTIDSKGWIIKAKYKGGNNELCEYYQEKIEEIFLNSPKWIPAKKNDINIEYTMMIMLNFT